MQDVSAGSGVEDDVRRRRRRGGVGGGGDGTESVLVEGHLRVVSHSSFGCAKSKSSGSIATAGSVYTLIDKSLTMHVYELGKEDGEVSTTAEKYILCLRLTRKTASLRVSGLPYSSQFTIEIPMETVTTFCAGTPSERAKWLHAMTASPDARTSIRRNIDEWWCRGDGGIFSIFRGAAGILGEGGQATVSCCIPKRRKWWALMSAARSSHGKEAHSRKRYALKRAKGQECARDMIRHELTILMELQRARHKCIPVVYDAIIEPNHRGAALVLELLSGGELFERVKLLQKFTEKQAKEIVVQLVSCLKHLHSRRICHRDLKAENVVYVHETSNRIKLVDFGASRVLKPSSASPVSLSRSTSSDDMASPTLQFGTFEYLAPECLEWSMRGFSSDMWSLGILVHLLLVGSLPFHAMSREDQEQAILHADVDFNTEAWVSVSYAARVFVRDLLTRSPMARLGADDAMEHFWLTNMFHTQAVSGSRRLSAPANIKFERAQASPQLDRNLMKNSLPRTPLASLLGSPSREANVHNCTLSTSSSPVERRAENNSPSCSPRNLRAPAAEMNKSAARGPGLLFQVDVTRSDVDEPHLTSPRRLRSHQNLSKISEKMRTLNSIKSDDDNRHISNHVKSMSCQDLRHLSVEA